MEFDYNQCFDNVQTILSENNLLVEELIKDKLLILAKEFANEKIGLRQNIPCEVHYYAVKSPEILIWALGLVCESWTLEILKQKTIDGHCHTHKGINQKSCDEGTKFHRDLYIEAKNSFEQVIRQTENQMPK
jgi:hypothetical protein